MNAREVLERLGWEEGMGLGKKCDGNVQPIKVVMKKDNAGIGYNASEEFTNHWWTLDFNKAASSIHINTTEGGIEVVSSTSCCKPKPTTGSNYRQFLKSQSTESNSESYSRDVGQSVKERFIYSDQLFTACSGRTGHKAARHGNRLLGKLKRLKRQEEHPSNESRKKKKIKASHTGKVKTT